MENGCISNSSFLSVRVAFHSTMIMGEKSSKLYHPHFSNVTRLPFKCHLLTAGYFFPSTPDRRSTIFRFFDELVTSPILRVETIILICFLGIMSSSNVLQGCVDVHSALIPYASSLGCLALYPWGKWQKSIHIDYMLVHNITCIPTFMYHHSVLCV